jgi:uncharacterized protein (DUF1330 family)
VTSLVRVSFTCQVIDAVPFRGEDSRVNDYRSPREDADMTAYAMAHLRRIDLNDQVREYLLRIDETLVPFGGRFLVHGSAPEVVDGELPGSVVLIEFPDHERAMGWYESPAYQAILPFRVDNSEGGAAILPAVPEGYQAASLVEKMYR